MLLDSLRVGPNACSFFACDILYNFIFYGGKHSCAIFIRLVADISSDFDQERSCLSIISAFAYVE